MKKTYLETGLHREIETELRVRSKSLESLLQTRGEPGRDEMGVLEKDGLSSSSSVRDGLFGESKAFGASHGD